MKKSAELRDTRPQRGRFFASLRMTLRKLIAQPEASSGRQYTSLMPTKERDGRCQAKGIVLRRLTLKDIGMKITRAQREYYRYTGISAELEPRGLPDVPGRDFSRLRARTQNEVFGKE